MARIVRQRHGFGHDSQSIIDRGYDSQWIVIVAIIALARTVTDRQGIVIVAIIALARTVTHRQGIYDSQWIVTVAIIANR